jgi:nucleoid-associated protein YgaU
MKSILTFAIAIGFMFALAGCQLFQKKAPAESTENDSTVVSQVTPDTPDNAAQPAPMESTEPAPAASQRVHVVQPKDTIYSIARQYYNGDMHQWRKIWQANQAEIPDPNKIKIGQKLVIPD